MCNNHEESLYACFIVIVTAVSASLGEDKEKMTNKNRLLPGLLYTLAVLLGDIGIVS